MPLSKDEREMIRAARGPAAPTYALLLADIEELERKLREATWDCGDSSCMFAPRPLRGQRTNGGCRCLINAGQPSSLVRAIPTMTKLIVALEKALRDLTNNAGSLMPRVGEYRMPSAYQQERLHEALEAARKLVGE